MKTLKREFTEQFELVQHLLEEVDRQNTQQVSSVATVATVARVARVATGIY